MKADPSLRATTIGSPFPIDNGASTRTLWRRVSYGGRKGHAAKRRLLALERRIARSGIVEHALASDITHMLALMDPVMRFAGGVFTSNGQANRG